MSRFTSHVGGTAPFFYPCFSRMVSLARLKKLMPELSFTR